jgi:Plasmid pRiA4b ORF-3-like protein
MTRFLVRGTRRYVVMPDMATLRDLHYEVYALVRPELTKLRGYDEEPWDHMHCFHVRGEMILSTVHEFWWEPGMDEQRTTDVVRIENLGLGVGDKIVYTYDLGDCWRFDLVLKETA